MRKLSICILSLVGLFIFAACQSTDKGPTAEEFATEFAQAFFTLSYDESNSRDDLYSETMEKLKPYFTEEGFSMVTKDMLYAIPCNAVEKNKTNISVKSVDLEESFNEENGDKIGFNVTVEVEVPEGIASQPMSISLIKENNEWKIYAIYIQKVVDMLQR